MMPKFNANIKFKLNLKTLKYVNIKNVSLLVHIIHYYNLL